VREITDRGGKGWRSYAALACCDVVGGDSRKYIHWLAMPELMHVGSLIVDDVQDRSNVRRGGPACHVVHGDALAINAGTSCYFMGQHLLQGTDVSNVQKLALYDLYFEALRAGHAGQAADIEGLWSYLPKAIESGDTRELESRVMAIHRLKTAAPAGALARMGALVGGGSQAQIEGLGRYFESLGLAFQMVDDVLNLKGFAGDLKMRGEDLAHGKVTLPVVKALAELPRAERQYLCDTILAKPQDQALVDGLIARIEATGGIEATARAARELVESAWWSVEPLLEPSIVKLMLRSFGWFVLERHY
jgi:geranylgeranyl pyrophosphate synthase